MGSAHALGQRQEEEEEEEKKEKKKEEEAVFLTRSLQGSWKA